MRLPCRALTILLLISLFIEPALSVSALPAQGTEIAPVPGEWTSNEVSYETTWGQTYRLSMAVTVSEDGIELSYITLFLNNLLGMVSVGTFNRSTPIESGTFTVDIEAGVVDREGDPVQFHVSGSFVDPMTLEASVTLSVADAPVELTAQPTEAVELAATEPVNEGSGPRPGRWEGDYGASFEVGEDGLVRDFEMTVPFSANGQSTDCTLRADDKPEFEVMADGSVSFSELKVKDSEIKDDFFALAQWAGIEIPTTTNEAGETLVILENVEGQFTSAEEFTGSFSVLICGGTFSAPASQGEWSARWVSGGPMAVAGEPNPQPAKWETEDTPLGQGSDFFRVGMSVELDDTGDWEFALINILFVSVDGTGVAGTWFPQRNVDGTFSAVREFPELGNATVTIEGRFVSPTEARGTLTYNDLPPIEWTARPAEE